jgi:LPXTG-motif cell wall-anchored protein
MADNTAVLTNVTKDNFEDYFSLNGSATYNQTTGIVTITPDENDKVGNFSLKSKIDMNSSFTLTGQVNLGNKTSSQGGADGIGFAFHNGNTTDVGNAGGNLGIAGLQDAIGFKLDTWHNDNFTPQATVPGAQVSSTDSNGFGWSQDPSNPQFGAFVTTDSEEIKATDEKPYQRWWATTDMSSVKGLSSNNLDGNFHNFVVSYDSHSRLLTINYTEASGNVLTWTKEVDSSYQEMAMIISASTGGAKNLQQFKITSFDFKQAATVNVKYVDTKGNQIAQGEVTYPNGANVNGTYSTGQLEIPNYKFVRMDDGTATGSNSLPAKGTLTKDGDNGTVIYVYAPAYTQTSKTISETIKYIDQDGKEVAKGYTADPITFVTVTNPVDNTTTTYYSTKAKTATLDDNGVPTEAGWTKADSTDFAEVVNPEVDGYKVISNDAPNSDLTNVAVQTVYTNSSDLDFTVVYAKNAPTITTESKTINETIHYVYKDGSKAADDYVAKPVEFTRQVSTDAVTGEKTYGNWSADQSFDAVTSPELKGYTADKAQIDKQTVNGDSKDLEFTVTYTKNAPTITTEKKTVNETIHYVYKDGSKAADDYVAKPVEFTRQVSTDAVTGEKTYGNWSADQSFDAVTSPELKGYTADKAQIDKQTVNGDSKDLEFTVTYTKNAPTITTDLKHQLTPGNPSQPSYATNNGAVNSPELPQTGESNSQSQTMSFIGILLAMFGSLLGFLGIKKRRND